VYGTRFCVGLLNRNPLEPFNPAGRDLRTPRDRPRLRRGNPLPTIIAALYALEPRASFYLRPSHVPLTVLLTRGPGRSVGVFAYQVREQTRPCMRALPNRTSSEILLRSAGRRFSLNATRSDYKRRAHLPERMRRTDIALRRLSRSKRNCDFAGFV